MKTNYNKHTRWLRAAALRVITIMAFLTALPGLTKAQTTEGPLDVSNCADKHVSLVYKPNGWYYSYDGQGDTKFNGTLTGTVVTNEFFTILSTTNDQATLTIDNANIETSNTTYPALFLVEHPVTQSLTIQINDSELTSANEVFYATTSNGPVVIRTGGTKPSKMTSETSAAIGLSRNDLTVDGGTQGLILSSEGSYAIQTAANNKANPRIELTGKISANRSLMISKLCTLKIEEGVQVVGSSIPAFIVAEATTYERPIIQWAYTTPPAEGTLTIKKEGTVVASFTTNGRLRNFGVGAEVNKAYTVWHTPTGGNRVQQIDGNNRKVFNVSNNTLLSSTGMTNATAAAVYDWTFDATANTITRETVTLNVTATGNTLMVNASPEFKDTTLDMTGTIADEDGNEYEITSINDNAFANKNYDKITLPATLTKLGNGVFKGTDIKELHLLHNNASDIATIGTDALALRSNICKVYVPKGKLTSGGYYNNTFDNWQGFAYIMEEGCTTARMYLTGWDLVNFPDFQPPFYPVGQNFHFKIEAKDKTMGLKVTTSKDKDNVSYDSETGIVTISDKQTGEFEIIIEKVAPITAGDNIIITDNGMYKEGESGTETPYSNCFGNGKDPLTIKSLTFANTAPISVTMKNLAIKDGLTVNDKANATITFEGNNYSYEFTVNAGGSLTLKKKEDIATTIKFMSCANQGTFKDETGLVRLTYITDQNYSIEINKEASSAAKEYVQSGGKVTLKVKAATEAETIPLTYQWQLQNATNKTWANVVEPAITRLSGAAYGQSETLEVSADAAGKYRCLVTGTASADNVTTLTHYTTVEMSNPVSEYIVTLPKVEGAITTPLAGDYYVTEGDWFYFTLAVDAEYNQSTPIVKANGKEIKTDTNGKYWIEYIYDNQKIEITGLVKNPAPVGIDGTDKADIKVWATDGTLYVHTPMPQKVSIYTVAGTVYKDLGTVNGDTQVAMPKGIYVVVIGNKTLKIAM